MISNNNWTTDKIGLYWLKNVFEPYFKPYSTGAKQMLILNGHSSYQSPEFEAFCKENVIICLCIPLHTFYLLQPLDVGVFGPLKGIYRKMVEEIMAIGNNYINKEDFLHLYPPAHKKVFT